MGHARRSAGTRGTFLRNTGCRSTLQEAARLTVKPSKFIAQSSTKSIEPSPRASKRARWLATMETTEWHTTAVQLPTQLCASFQTSSASECHGSTTSNKPICRSTEISAGFAATRTHRNLPHALVRRHASAVEAWSHVPCREPEALMSRAAHNLKGSPKGQCWAQARGGRRHPHGDSPQRQRATSHNTL